jgi:predicted SprT family Zn-dependent metalloprotease
MASRQESRQPAATEQFQKISGAYEVLSDEKRRDLYDRTGCADEDELGDGGFEHAADFFAAFFGSFAEDLDADEQSMLDEFLRMGGGSAFKRGGRRKKGKGGSKPSKAAKREQEMMEDMFMAAMMGGMGGMGMDGIAAEVSCPAGHTLKKTRTDAVYECDMCGGDIQKDRRVYDCRKCDYSVCQKCHKKAEEEAFASADMGNGDDMLNELLEVFCETHTRPVRTGSRMSFQCEICSKTMMSQTLVLEHMEAEHGDELGAFVEEAMSNQMGMGMGMPGMDPHEMSEMASMMDALLGADPGSGGKRKSGKRNKKR